MLHPWHRYALALALALGCSSSKSSIFDVDAGDTTDAGATDTGQNAGDAGRDCTCTPGPHNDFIFALSDSSELYSYDPVTNAFALVSGSACGSAGRPFSMAVDSKGFAWILSSTTSDLMQVDVKSPGTCVDPGYNPIDPLFGLFGMSFSFEDESATCERLFALTYSGSGPFREGPDLGALGAVDPASLTIGEVGRVDYDGGELAGTGDGRLFAFAGVDPSKLVELDKETAEVIEITPLEGLSKTNASAFAFHSGDFYFFTEAPPPGCDECLTAECGDHHTACLEDELCSGELACAIELGTIQDDCGGLLPEALQTCLTNPCLEACLPSVRTRVSQVTHLDYDESDGQGRTLQVVNPAAPARIVGAGSSTCVTTVPF